MALELCGLWRTVFSQRKLADYWGSPTTGSGALAYGFAVPARLLLVAPVVSGGGTGAAWFWAALPPLTCLWPRISLMSSLPFPTRPPFLLWAVWREKFFLLYILNGCKYALFVGEFTASISLYSYNCTPLCIFEVCLTLLQLGSYQRSFWSGHTTQHDVYNVGRIPTCSLLLCVYIPVLGQHNIVLCIRLYSI